MAKTDKNKLNSSILIELLKDKEVREQLDAIIRELFDGKKEDLIASLLPQILDILTGANNTNTGEKTPWYKKLFNWVKALVPIILTFFKRK